MGSNVRSVFNKNSIGNYAFQIKNYNNVAIGSEDMTVFHIRKM